MNKAVGDARRPVLLGNSFPLSLVRRRVVVEPVPLSDLQARVRADGLCSFWGHANTVAMASELLGANVAPAVARPALQLAPDGRPLLDGQVFDECWLLSPDYVPGFRPAVGEEVPADKIVGWQVLRIAWNKNE